MAIGLNIQEEPQRVEEHNDEIVVANRSVRHETPIIYGA